jgi:hypothetical protein
MNMNEHTKYNNEYHVNITNSLDPQDYEYQITIDGEVYDVFKVKPSLSYGGLPAVECYGVQFYIARDSEHAGEAVKQYYRDMICDSPDEFKCIIGTETLISWGMGLWAGVARNLEGWLSVMARIPERHWGTHDLTEYEITQVSQDIVDDLGWVPSVAYRCG